MGYFRTFKKKIMTTGTFDILHYGHINLLKKAKSMGDYLVVGLNVTKNGKKTFYPYKERKKMLEAIKYVDKVVRINTQADKFKYTDDIDLFVIGDDYIGHPDVEEVKKYLPVKFIKRTPNISTSKIKECMKGKKDEIYYHEWWGLQ